MLAGPMPPLATARALLAALAAAAALAGSGVTPAAAVGSVPREGGGVLPGQAQGAIVGDVDGDGVRELVRLVPWDANPGLLALEVVRMVGDVPSIGDQVVVERATSVEDVLVGSNRDEDELLPLRTSDPARLIAWRGGGRERVLLATMQGDPGSAVIERSCCLTLWWVTLDSGGGTELRYIGNTAASGAWIVAADMDADGTDELAVVETPNPASPTAAEIMVLRWNGRAFDRLRTTAREGLISGRLTVLGDSDGRPGEEVGYVAQPGTFDATAPTLHRFALVDGRLRVDRSEVPESGSVVPIAGPRGGRLALVSGGGVHLLRWPAAAAEATVQVSSTRGGEPLGVLGDGASARLLVMRGGAVDLLDVGLRSRQGLPGGAAAAWFAASSLPPYRGELHGGDGSGAPGIVFGGRLIAAPDPPSNQAAFREIAVLAGKVPIGLFGEGLGWAAVGSSHAFQAERRGGGLLVGSSARAGEVAVVPAAALMAPEVDGGLLEPEIAGGLLDATQPARPILITGRGAIARLAAPPDSVIQVTSRNETRASTTLPDGTADVVLVEDIDSDANENFTVRLLVSTPAGHGYGAIWEARVLHQPPGLRASAPFASLAFTVPISGRTNPSALLVVDGTPVAVAPDGTFAADVGAGLLPRPVRLAATDRVGNTTEIVVEVVALLDYRQLPWVPMVVGLTLVAGAVLYLRAPRPGAIGAQHPDEGVLEEIQ
jgi:hypothetical protein